MSDRIRLRARVASVRHYLDTAGASWLHLVLQQTPDGHCGHRALPGLVARRHVGTGPAAQIAAGSLAQHLRPGDSVVAWGDAIGVCPHSGHLQLLGCTQIERVDAPRADPAPTARAAVRTTTETTPS